MTHRGASAFKTLPHVGRSTELALLGEWLNDGREEVIRVLTLWATREETSATPRIELGGYLAEYLAGHEGDEVHE